MTGLADIISASRPGTDLRVGTVAAITGNLITVTLGDAALERVPRLTSYTPTAGDRVVVLITPAHTAIAIGKIAGT